MPPEDGPRSGMSVECGAHGNRGATLVCQHLVSGKGLGVCLGHDPEDPLALYPDAWCPQCEESLAAAGEWTEELAKESGLQLLCSGCYVEVCARNWIEDGRAYKAMAKACLGKLRAAQNDLIRRFNLARWERWDWNMEREELIFSHKGKSRIIAKVTFVGSYSSADGTWMWAWGNESLPRHVRFALGKVKSAGERTGFRRLVLGHWAADEDDGWYMAAYACHVLRGLGAYRTPMDSGHVYMIIRDANRIQ